MSLWVTSAIGIGRRQFISALGVATVAWPLAARAQQSAMPIVGFVHPASPSEYVTQMSDAFSDSLKAAGYVDGQNLTIEYRWAEGHNERLPALMADLIGRRVAAIFAPGGPAAARRDGADGDNPDRFSQRRRSGGNRPRPTSQSARRQRNRR